MFNSLKKAFAKFSVDDKTKKKKVKEKEKAKKEKLALKEQKKQEREVKKAEQSSAEPLAKAKGKESFFEKRAEKKLSEKLEELEEDLIQNNISVDVATKISSELKDVPTRNVKDKLKEIIYEILTKPKKVDLEKLANEKKKDGEPFVILFVGINGCGKTTTIAKLTHLFKNKGFSCVLAAGDTWRSAAFEQLQAHADKLKVKMIKHKYGADPAAVAFDAIAHAKAKGINIVMIDTAGRQHSADDLMAELAKIKRVSKPDFTIFVGESITGNDCVTQVETFNKKIGVDGIILTKADVDERGGTLLSITYTIQKPILFIGVGQTYNSLKQFNADSILKTMLD